MKIFPPEETPGSSQRLLAILALVAAALLLLRLHDTVRLQLRAPFDLIYETPNLSTVHAIQGGENPYSPGLYDEPPFLLTLYTPLYHYLVAALPSSASNPFLTGRIVSMLSMLAAAAALFLVVPPRRETVIPSLLGAATFFSFGPVCSNTAFLKNDPLALLFSAAAVILAARGRRPWTPAAAAVLCLLAVMTKQSYVAAAAACLVYYLLSNRRHAAVFVLCGLGLGGLIAAGAGIAWGPGFWFSTLRATRQAMTWRHATLVLQPMLRQPLFILLLLLTAVLAAAAIRRRSAVTLRDSPYPLYVLFSGVILAATIGKLGSSTNYFFEFLLAQLMWIVFALGGAVPAPAGPRTRIAILSAFILCGAAELTLGKRADYAFVDKARLRERTVACQRLREDVASLGMERPVVLNPFTHRHTYCVTDRICLNDPYLYRLLWRDGILSPDPFLKSISDRRYDVILLPSGLGPPSALLKPYDSIVSQVLDHYELGATNASLHLYVRKAGHASPGAPRP